MSADDLAFGFWIGVIGLGGLVIAALVEVHQVLEMRRRDRRRRSLQRYLSLIGK